MQEIIVDLRSWQLDKMQSAEEVAQTKTIQIVIDSLAINGFLDSSERVATTLNHQMNFFSAALPVLLKKGEFERAEQIAEKLSNHNPNLRIYYALDVFVARAIQNDLDDALDYLDSRGRGRIPTSHLNNALARIAKYYREIDNRKGADRVLNLIKNERDQQIARALLAANRELTRPIEIDHIVPFFLRLLHESESPNSTRRREEVWYVVRVELLKAKLAGDSARATRMQAILDELPTFSEGFQGRSFETGLDALISFVSGDSQAVTKATNQLQEWFGNEVFCGKQHFDRKWIAYVMARTGKWGLKDLKDYWKAWDKQRPYDWVIGFATGYYENGNGDRLDQLIAITDRMDARCYLKTGRLIGQLSRTASANLAREQTLDATTRISR